MLLSLFVLIITICPVRSKWAMVVTIAGDKKLSDYFEWTCRSIGFSNNIIDMLVFHEGNKKLLSLSCSDNVKLIDLGPNGLAKAISKEILSQSKESTLVTYQHLNVLLSYILTHMPRYLVEIKPMTGSLFKEYLKPYSHWTYTDPDVIWGNLEDWIDSKDTETFDIVTAAKMNDAGRLFIRGQFALHKNSDKINELWKILIYFSPEMYVKRIALSYQALKEGKNPTLIFTQYCNSAEGWYSYILYQEPSISIKILGRGYDDYNLNPVILTNSGRLIRCTYTQLEDTLSQILNNTYSYNIISSYKELPPITEIQVNPYQHIAKCYMSWIPEPTRLCIGTPMKRLNGFTNTNTNTNTNLRNNKKSLVGEYDENTDNFRIIRLGEVYSYGDAISERKLLGDNTTSTTITPLSSIFTSSSSSSPVLPTNTKTLYTNENSSSSSSSGVVNSQRISRRMLEKNRTRIWYANDESVSKRQNDDYSAFFHFRHWDDQASKGVSTTWTSTLPSSSSSFQQLSSIGALSPPYHGCMVLYIRDDKYMAYESCTLVLRKLISTREIYHQVYANKVKKYTDYMAKKLKTIRRKNERGSSSGTITKKKKKKSSVLS